MAQFSVRYQKQFKLTEGIDKAPVALPQAVAKVKEMAGVRADRTYKNGRRRKDWDQTVDVVLHLGIDPKQADQLVRGAISLPKGIGKTRSVIAFCDGAVADEARKAGAKEAGADELIDKVAKGWTDFDVAVAHPSMMGKVGKLGKVLGPQGKMPTPKAGTVTPDIATAVREFSAGRLEFRNDAGGNIHMPVGKASFPEADLRENIEAVIKHIQRVKPAAAKGHFLKKVVISGTHTPSVIVDTAHMMEAAQPSDQ